MQYIVEHFFIFLCFTIFIVQIFCVRREMTVCVSRTNVLKILHSFCWASNNCKINKIQYKPTERGLTERWMLWILKCRISDGRYDWTEARACDTIVYMDKGALFQQYYYCWGNWNRHYRHLSTFYVWVNQSRTKGMKKTYGKQYEIRLQHLLYSEEIP